MTFPAGDAAVQLARAGLAVFPLKPTTKVPLTRRGFHDATTVERRVRAWWAQVPHANIGIATGPSNLVVIDLDCGKPWPQNRGTQPYGVNDGADSLIHLAEQTGNIDDLRSWFWTVPRVATPSGGIHLYFSAPDGARIRSTAGVIAPWVDVKAAGGYVVAPWSWTAESATSRQGWYRTVHGFTTIDTARVDIDWNVHDARLAALRLDLPTLPSWLTSLTADKPAVQLDRWGRLARRLSAPRASSGYFDAALAKACDTVAAAPEGQRNHVLNREAYAIAGFIPHLDETTIRDALTSAAAASGLDGQEIAATLASAIKRGKSHPREVVGYA